MDVILDENDYHFQPVGPPGRSCSQLDEAARSAGRNPGSLGIALIQNAFVSRDEDAWETARAGLAHLLGTYRAWEAGADTPDHDRLEPIPPAEETMRTLTPTGTPGEVLRALLPLVEAFGDRELHLIVRLHYPGMGLEPAARAVELFGGEVLPALKGS